MASLNQIRSLFVDYFRDREHAAVPSGSLVPYNDPTLLFANSGMVQFKDVFTGREPRAAERAVTVQKCLRAGGKHNDLDNVGYTARHHTFFEMMGNFSFGDYFKERAIELAWGLVVDEMGLPPDRLLATVYAEDEEAAGLWSRVAGLPDERILRIPTADNFWSMGATGPCGPCSEIFYDHGESVAGGPPGSPDEDGDRFVEIWNLVFMQFEQFADGTRTPLERPSIDTGMGLERIGAVLQGKHDNFETDLFQVLIDASVGLTGAPAEGENRAHHRVIADHLRAVCFLVADGVLPSNAGRGYVLRRILRRAMRHAHHLGAEEPLLWRLVPALLGQMGAAYPQLDTTRELAEDTLRGEEERFRSMLERGLGLLDAEVAKLGEGQPLSGEVAFRLFDTYGFPADLTEDALRERGRTLDVEGFEAAMAEQRERSRAARAVTGDEHAGLWMALDDELPDTEFLGWNAEWAQGQMLAIVRDGERVERATAGERVELVVNQTPFYAEAGGQVGDIGTVATAGGRATVEDTTRRGGLIRHHATVDEGALSAGEGAELDVDSHRRGRIRANHSSTHLLHEALRERLGEHVEQRGSLVDGDRLRFDFAQRDPVDPADLAEIEAEVNRQIRENAPVAARIMDRDAAMESGARALFGEKYGDEVRVVSMGSRGDGDAYSVELCGGTHVERTGDIGVFKVVREQAVAAGVRRIEAVSGEAALARFVERDRLLGEVEAEMKTSADEVVDRVRGLREENRKAKSDLAQLRQRLASGGAEATEVRDVGGTPYLARRVSDVAAKDLRGIVEACQRTMESGVVAVAAETDGKAAIAVGVSGDLTRRYSAVDLVRLAATELGGKGGGGRPDLAQAGGPDAARIDDALAAVEGALG